MMATMAAAMWKRVAPPVGRTRAFIPTLPRLRKVDDDDDDRMSPPPPPAPSIPTPDGTRKKRHINPPWWPPGTLPDQWPVPRPLPSPGG
jgi:hypothetical protein